MYCRDAESATIAIKIDKKAFLYVFRGILSSCAVYGAPKLVEEIEAANITTQKSAREACQ